MTQTEAKEPSMQQGVEEKLGLIIRYRWLFFSCVVLCFLASLVVGLVMPREYETTSIIQVKYSRALDSISGDNMVRAGADVKNAFDTLSKQILAWSRIEQMVQRLHMADDIKSPVERERYITAVRERIKIHFARADTVELSFTDPSPALAQQVVNTLTQTFSDENARIKKDDARNTIDFITEQLKNYREKLDSSQQNFSTSKIDASLQAAINKRDLLLDRLKDMQKVNVAQVSFERNPVIGQLQTRIGQAEAELSRLSMDAREGNPRVATLKQEIQGMRDLLIEEMQKSSVKESVNATNPVYQQTEQELKALQLEIATLTKRRDDLLEGIGQGPKKSLSEVELANLERSRQVDEDIYKSLLKQLESATLAENLQESESGARFTVVEYARLPLTPVKPNMVKVLLMGLAGGLGLGLGLVLLLDMMSKSFQTTEQVQSLLNLDALGAISLMVSGDANAANPSGAWVAFKKRVKDYAENNRFLSNMKFISAHAARRLKDPKVSEFMVAYHEPKSIVADEFRVLRMLLTHGAKTAGPEKVISLTSTLRGEGKSTTSSNLSVVFAKSGKKTVLVDCDLRKGVVHENFGMQLTPGLVQYLNDTTVQVETLFQTMPDVPNLTLIAAGAIAENPAELLDSPRLKVLLDALREQFDIVLLDVPPILSLPDAGLICRYVDRVVMVIQAGRTRRSDVVQAKAKLEQINAPLVGYVLTNVQYYMPRYLYSYYYNYH
jgi:succinoglycan biosynthesis transport protein ExoP